jgi:Fe2+ or Zn2+ uptake regulation protein
LAELADFEKSAVATLRAAGLRITSARVAVIRTLAKTDIALGAYQIRDTIISAGGVIDATSIYRILSTLLEAKLIYRVGRLDAFFRRSIQGSGESLLLIDSATGRVKEVRVPGEVGFICAAAAHANGCTGADMQIEVCGVLA